MCALGPFPRKQHPQVLYRWPHAGIIQIDNSAVDLSLSGVISGVGNLTQQAQRNADVQQLVFKESIRQRQSISGVNLDEEAANLLRYQQAYQASAQVIRAANEVFRVLLDIVR